MSKLWIVHRSPQHGTALARIAGAGPDAVVGAPDDARFASAPAADVVVLGLTGDFESELEFAHRHLARTPRASWILVAPPSTGDEVTRLFDTLGAEVLRDPPTQEALRRAVRGALGHRLADPLSRRAVRDRVAARFARWLGGLEHPDLVRALDPRRAHLPVLLLGEPGTGRRLLARYVHEFAVESPGDFVAVGCEGVSHGEELLFELRRAAAGHEAGRVCTLWLEDADRLPRGLQRGIPDWIELGPPEVALPARALRWMVGARDPGTEDGEGLEPRLAHCLAPLAIRLAPLREQPDRIEVFARETARAYCQARGEPLRRFDDRALAALRAHPWPGNLAELEAVVLRTLSATPAEVIGPADLRFEDPHRLPPAAAAARRAERLAVEAESAAEAQAPGERPRPVPAEARAPQPRAPAAPPADPIWRRLARAVAHEVRNPLVSVRTFAEMLPEHHADPEFRTRFAERVGADLRRVEDSVSRLQSLAELPGGEIRPVDVSQILDALLEERREQIQSRRLLVLKELDRSQPHALGDARPLRAALEGLLARALESVPEGGDVYLATHRRADTTGSAPVLRILLRYRGAGPTPARAAVAAPDLSEAANALEFVVAEAIVRAQGGALTIDATDARETLILIDLPAPPEPPRREG